MKAIVQHMYMYNVHGLSGFNGEVVALERWLRLRYSDCSLIYHEVVDFADLSKKSCLDTKYMLYLQFHMYTPFDKNRWPSYSLAA